MERLTQEYWANCDPWELCGLGDDCKRSCACCTVALKLRRLAMYEDTGVDHTEITKLLVSQQAAEDFQAELGKALAVVSEITQRNEPLNCTTFGGSVFLTIPGELYFKLVGLVRK